MTKFRTRETLTIYWQHARRYPLAIFVTAISVTAAVCFETYRPLLYKQFFDILQNGDTNRSIELVYVIISVLIINILEWIGWRTAVFSDSFLAARVMSDLLNTCFEYIHGHSYNFFNNTFVGSLVRKVNRYARSYEDITDQILWDLGPTALTMAFIIVVLYLRQPLLAYIILGWTLVYVGVNYVFVAYKLKFDLKRAEADTKTSGHLADTITNNLNLKLFGATESEFSAYKKLTEELYNLRRLTWNLDSISEGIQSAFMIVLEFLVMYYAIKFWKQGLLTIGDFALIQAYLIRMFQSLWNVGKYMRRIYEALADAQEMTEILTEPHEIQDVSGARVLTAGKGQISFNKVTFGYTPNHNVLDKFNLTIASGERVALIGPSGGGKTTIVKLLLRFFDIQSGHILIDGQDIAKVTQQSLRENVALVPQEPVLFHRSLYENIRYAKPSATKAEVESAAKLAHAHEFIMSFPEGYETFVGERGVKLSGGERQRVAIARAILKNAPILVLDEATSSLDSESERLIQDALHTLMHGKTTIVIAHRLSTIMAMDRIVVVDKGKILEQGKHQELLKVKQGKYQRLWHVQAGGFSAK